MTILYLNNYKRKEVITLSRTKGSKNRPKTNITKDYASQIAEKQETVASLNTEIASIQKAIEEQKNTLKEQKTALKKAEKEVATLEAKKAKADAKAAEEAKKTEAEAVLKKLLASGMSADEILEKLK
jgi:Tfp pilus assembly protein PilN